MGEVVAQSLTDLVHGLELLGTLLAVGLLGCQAWIRSRPLVQRWRDRRHVRRCWRAVQEKTARVQAGRPR